MNQRPNLTPIDLLAAVANTVAIVLSSLAVANSSGSRSGATSSPQGDRTGQMPASRFYLTEDPAPADRTDDDGDRTIAID